MVNVVFPFLSDGFSVCFEAFVVITFVHLFYVLEDDRSYKRLGNFSPILCRADHSLLVGISSDTPPLAVARLWRLLLGHHNLLNSYRSLGTQIRVISRSAPLLAVCIHSGCFSVWIFTSTCCKLVAMFDCNHTRRTSLIFSAVHHRWRYSLCYIVVRCYDVIQFKLVVTGWASAWLTLFIHSRTCSWGNSVESASCL